MSEEELIRERGTIAAEHLTVTFEAKRGLFGHIPFNAVDDISMLIERGSTVALVGESGSGKTTLGKTLIGLIKPTSGHIYFHGKDVWRMTKDEFMDFRMKSQIIHQDPYSSLNPYKSVYDVLALPLRAHHLAGSKEEEREAVYKMLEEVGLIPAEFYAEKYPFELSGGQRQRVSIARAMLLQPEFVVADEPITMLDASLRLGILDTMMTLQRKMDLSMLFITHDLGMAYYIAGKTGKIAVMYLGSVVEFGSAERVLKDPMHPYTKALLSAIPEPDPKRSRSKQLMKLTRMDPPDPSRAPPGCKFSDRCPFAFDRCRKERPKLSQVGDEQVACFLYPNAEGTPVESAAK